MEKIDFDGYLQLLHDCTSLSAMDCIMDIAAEDLQLSAGDFLQLIMYCRGRIEDEGWLD